MGGGVGGGQVGLGGDPLAELGAPAGRLRRPTTWPPGRPASTGSGTGCRRAAAARSGPPPGPVPAAAGRPPTRGRRGRSGPRSAAARPPRPRAARPPSRPRPEGRAALRGARGGAWDRGERWGRAGPGTWSGCGHRLPAPALALALDVDQPLLAGTHEPLELLLELWVLGRAAGPARLGLPVGGGLLDREVDLAVFLEPTTLTVTVSSIRRCSSTERT